MAEYNMYLFHVIIIYFFKCGESAREPKIVGGSFAKIAEYPHSVFMNAQCDRRQWICGASVLNQRLILTAAHCVFGCTLKNDRIETLVGHENLKHGNIMRRVSKFLMHKYYDEISVSNDIALARLENDIPLGRLVQRVTISRRFSPEITKAYIAGWGVTCDDTYKITKRLKHVSQKLRSKTKCAELGELTAGMFCAGSLRANDSHPSLGDSGSALVVNGHQQIGLVSFRILEMPTLMVYTNVTYYYSWITGNANILFCN